MSVAVAPYVRPPLLTVRAGQAVVVAAGSGLVALGASRGVREGLVGLAVIAVGLLALGRPVVAGLVVVAVVPVTAGLARGLVLPHLRLSEALVLATALLLTVTRPARGRPAPRTAVDNLALTHAVGAVSLGLLDLWLRRSAVQAEDLRSMLAPFQYYLLYRVVVTTLVTRRSLVWGLRLLVLGSVPVAAVGLLQFGRLLSFDDRVLRWTGATVFDRVGWTPPMRATGLFPDWHGLAGYLLVVTVVAVALLVSRGPYAVLPPRVLVPVVALNLLAMTATVTIVAALCLAVAVAILGLMERRGPQVAAACLLAVALLVLVFPGTIADRIEQQRGSGTTTVDQAAGPQTLAYRIDVWHRQYLPALEGNTLTGFGPDLPPGILWEHTESEYVTLLLRGGLVYLAVWLALLGVTMWTALSVRDRRDPVSRPLASAAVALCLVVPVYGVIYPVFTNVGLPHALWACWGMLVASRQVTSHRGVPPARSEGHRAKLAVAHA